MGIFSELMREIEAPKPCHKTRVAEILEQCPFPKFKALPPEIRNIIWGIEAKSEALTPRIQEITWKANRSRKYGRIQLFIVPPLLHACHDSRKIAMEAYQVTDFGGQLPYPIFFKPNLDVLLFPTVAELTKFAMYLEEGTKGHMDNFLDNVRPTQSWDGPSTYRGKPDPPALQTIQRIIIGIQSMKFHDSPRVIEAVARMKGLREVIFEKNFINFKHEGGLFEKLPTNHKNRTHIDQGVESTRLTWVEEFNAFLDYHGFDSFTAWGKDWSAGDAKKKHGWVVPKFTYRELKSIGRCNFQRK